MLRPPHYQMLFWLALAIAAVAVIVRALWLYRASLTWPAAEGSITRLDIERKESLQAVAISAQLLATSFSTPMADVFPGLGTRISRPKQKLATSPYENCPSVNPW